MYVTNSPSVLDCVGQSLLHGIPGGSVSVIAGHRDMQQFVITVILGNNSGSRGLLKTLAAGTEVSCLSGSERVI